MSNVVLYDGSGNVISSTNPLNVQLAGSIQADLISSYLTNATPWYYTQDSAANTAQTITIAAEAGKAHYITYLEVALSVAAAGADIAITIKDGTTVKYKTLIGNAAVVGTRVAVQFPYPLTTTVGNAAYIVVAAGGAATTVTVANIGGYTM